MASKQACLRQLDQVRQTAGDAETAYLLRTRLRRSVLNVSRMVAKREGLAEPVIPGRFMVPADASANSNVCGSRKRAWALSTATPSLSK